MSAVSIVWRGVTYSFPALFRATHTLGNKVTDTDSESGKTKGDRITHSPDIVSIDIGATQCSTNAAEKPKKVFDILSAIRDTKETVIIYTQYKTYRQMVIESINVQEDYTTRHSLKATVNFKELVEDATSSSGSSHTTGRSSSGQQSGSGTNNSVLYDAYNMLKGK